MSKLVASNRKSWFDEHRRLLKPPVGNQYLYRGQDFFVMVVVGRNARNDFHVTAAEEFFDQLKADITSTFGGRRQLQVLATAG